MLSKSVQGDRKKLAIVGLIIFACVLFVTTYVNAAYQVQRPIANTGGKINQLYLWGESTTINGGTPVSHKGIDFPYGTGTQVYATDDGTVVQIRQNWANDDKSANDLWGNYVLIRHTRQHFDRVNAQWAYVYSLFLHLSQNSVTVNQGGIVTAGQLIAQSDNTGQYSSGSHLHYQVVINGDANAILEPNNTLSSESRSRNPELWLAPFNFNNVNTARAVGRLSDTSRNSVGGKFIVGLQKPPSAGGTCGATGYASSLTYSYAWTNPDDILVENFGTTDVQPGTYHLYADNGFNASTCAGTGLYKDLGNYTFVAGQTTYIGLYPVYLPDVRGNLLGGWTSSITVRNNSTTDTAKVNTTFHPQRRSMHLWCRIITAVG